MCQALQRRVWGGERDLLTHLQEVADAGWLVWEF